MKTIVNKINTEIDKSMKRKISQEMLHHLVDFTLISYHMKPIFLEKPYLCTIERNHGSTKKI